MYSENNFIAVRFRKIGVSFLKMAVKELIKVNYIIAKLYNCWYCNDL